MNSKILIIVIAAVVIIAGAAAFLALGGGNSKSSDYTLLDSDDNIKKGMTIGLEMDADNANGTMTCTVNSVEDGTVNYTEKTESTREVAQYKDPEMYTPEGFAFDYTDEEDIPDGVTVDPTGDSYKITGTQDSSAIGYTSIYKYNLTIVYDGEDVISVDGTISLERGSGEYTMTMEMKLKTTDGEISNSVNESMVMIGSCDVDDFYDEVMQEFDEEECSAIITDVKDGKFGGVDVKIYTLNGTADNTTYDNCKVYVYDGYVIKMEGTFIDEDAETTYENATAVYTIKA